MDCPDCHRSNPPENAFCGGCGSPLARSCPDCGRENAPDHNFCGRCGRALKEGAARRSAQTDAPPPSGERPEAAPAAGSPRLSPRDYTPKHLAEQILTSKSALEGERKQVTVLFADVKGSMDLAEQVDPEEWHRILNRFFEILTDGVHRFEGTVNQYTGDGIMALFGAPITHEDHAHRACYTVLHLRDELRKYAEELKRTRELTFAVRMGLNSGEVIVGKIGDDLRMDYTAQGHTVGLAARLEQLADPGKAYVSESTAKLVSGYFGLRDLGTFEMKGVGRPRRVYELEGPGRVRTRLDVSKARGLSRFVGRAEEMAALQQSLDRAVEGNAQVVGIVAEAGTGKSRLCYEFLEKARARGVRVREVHCVAHGKSIPLLPVFELLRGFFGVSDRDSDHDARRKIAGTLLLLDRELTDSLPVLFEFLGIADSTAPPSTMNPEAKRRQILALSRRTIQARNREDPGIILIEDLHWIDGGSEQFLENLIEALPGTRTLLLLNFRPEYQPGFGQKSYYRQIPILPLRPDEIAELIDCLLGRDASLGDLPRRLQAQASGNPFFVEEAVQSLVESEKLRGTRGAYVLAGTVEEITIPASVQALLGARIDRLAEREKQLLQTAAVVGKEFSERLIREVSALGDAELGDALRALVKGEFIYESALYPELEYAFKHPLTQEVAYRSQLGDRRARTHAAVARALVNLHAEKQDEHAALIAHHYEHAGEAREAAQWHMRAAEWAGLRDPGESLRHWQSVLALLEDLPESQETAGLGTLARIQTLNLGWRLGMPLEKAQQLYREGVALAEGVSNTHALSILNFVFSAVLNLAGETDRAGKSIAEALRFAEATGDPGLVLGCRVNLAFNQMLRGEIAEAIAVYEDIIAHPPENERLGVEAVGFSPLAQAYFLRSNLYGMMGRLETCEAALPEAQEVARRNDDMEVLGWLHTAYVYLREYQGEYGDIVDWGRKAVELAEKSGTSFSRILAYLVLGGAFLRTDEFEASRAQLQHVLDLARESKAGLMMEGRVLGYLGEAHLGLGNRDEALRCAREGVRLLEGRGVKFYEIRTTISLIRVLLATEGKGAADEIEALIDRTVRDSERCGMKAVIPMVLEARADLCALRGDEAGRLRDLGEARRLYAENGATGHLRRLDKVLSA